MLDTVIVGEIAGAAARAHLNSKRIARVWAEPAVDSVGQDALRITIVLNPGQAAGLTGDDVLDTLVAIQQQLRQAGEDRLAIIDYATEDELANGGDSQS